MLNYLMGTLQVIHKHAYLLTAYKLNSQSKQLLATIVTDTVAISKHACE